jgi:hypothetical protein
MSTKKIHSSSIIGQQGVNLVERVVLGMGFAWYPSGGVEAGIDGTIEIRDAVTGEATNSIIQVQSKATTNPFQAETESTFEFRCAERDLDYWMQGNVPVILVVSRPKSGEAYWVSIKDHFRDPGVRAGRKVRFDKEHDRFDEGCKDALVSLAVPKDAGLYFAPPPKEETLYSNLLKVSHFPEQLYAAQTDYRTGQDVRAKLNEMGAREQNEWFAKYKSILSFNDLSEWPWDEICEQGTVEAFDSGEWAYSDDPDTQRDFVQLLNRCLSAKAYALGLRYDKDHHCHYFKATNDLSDLKLGYKSLVNETARTVFRRYPKKGNREETAYYRHSAFEGRFKRFDDAWYLEITPTYHFTGDGQWPSAFYEDNLTGIKQLETNQAVLGQTAMWAEYLSRDGNLLEPQYPMLRFEGLVKVELGAGIEDEAWLARDKEGGEDESSDGLVLFER